MTMKPKDFPPGPPYLPILGSTLFLPRKLVHVTMAGEWRRKYGSVVGLFFGHRTVVAICGPKEVLEVLRREEFQVRPNSDFFKARSFGKKLGVFFSDGPFWVEQRRFTLRHLRDFGFGKKSMEGFILDEVEDTLSYMKELKVMQVTGLFSVPTLNVLWGMIAGTRYDRNDERLKDLLNRLTMNFRSGNPTGGIINIFPILMTIAPGLSGFTKFKETLVNLQNYIGLSIKEHEQTLDQNNPRDLIDVYLREMRKQNHPDSTFTEQGLITICLDLFAAGGETTTSTLGFCLMYMLLYPEVQKKVRNELDAVVGRDRRPSLEDRPKLPYVEAVLTEVFRLCSIAPMTPPHCVDRDTYINGYLIPKDSMVLVVLYSLFQDKEHWGDPEVFRPERFLDADGKLVKDEWMIPFGMGKRMCLGEVLARSVVFLFFTSIVQEFLLSIPEGDTKPSTVPLSGFTIAPAPFRIKVTERT
ncbi:hypothetical protein ANN_23568 [Periplaneta americana]|uniref:Cytochrome P450 n=1 Tax=Periplaneta americana TaxID=6978 RepID=A0ABQ8SLG3_PERAM|nr:hypothetical protein ANN_23568 [Periplaneta americana]